MFTGSEHKFTGHTVYSSVARLRLRGTQSSEVKCGINQVLHTLIHDTHTHTHTTSLHTVIHSRREILILQGMDTLVDLFRCFIHEIALL